MNKTTSPETMNPETGTRYSRAELKAAFERVQNAQNWKLPIDTVIPSKDKEVTEEAIIFFAGCRPYFVRGIKGHLRVQAVGYYAAVGA